MKLAMDTILLRLSLEILLVPSANVVDFAEHVFTQSYNAWTAEQGPFLLVINASVRASTQYPSSDL